MPKSVAAVSCRGWGGAGELNTIIPDESLPGSGDSTTEQSFI